MKEDTVEYFEAFQRGGTGLTITQWDALSAEEQAAAIEASNRIAAERAALIAYYMTYPVEMMKMIAGDEAAIKVALKK